MILFLLIFIISFFCYYLSLGFMQINDFIEKVVEKKTIIDIFANTPTIKTEAYTSSGEEIEEDVEEDENDDGKKSLFRSSNTIKYKPNYDKDDDEISEKVSVQSEKDNSQKSKNVQTNGGNNKKKVIIKKRTKEKEDENEDGKKSLFIKYKKINYDVDDGELSIKPSVNSELFNSQISKGTENIAGKKTINTIETKQKKNRGKGKKRRKRNKDW